MLRIAVIADIMERIPPQYYGGVERVVYLLIKYLVKRGHKVTLFASDDSLVPCRLIPFGHRSGKSAAGNARNLFTLYAQLIKLRKEFDIIQCFGRTLYLLPLLPLPLIKIQSYGCPTNPKKIRRAHRLARGTLTFVACSHSCARERLDVGRWEIIYHGVEFEEYKYNPNPEGKYLAFLGRLCRIKGVHTAIDIAKAAHQQLKIAGTIASCGPDLEYFKNEIEPRIDGNQIQYIGSVDDKQKSEFLGQAGALLFPIEWEEPFGLVIIEAMACGTPVIALKRGAVPEIVSDGINGFICNSKSEMISAIGNIYRISRQQCRKTVETRFCAEKAALEYERLYARLLGAVR